MRNSSESAPWTDEALASAADDTLNRAAYARRASHLIQTTHSFDSSSVLGLSGEWGSGKTSLINMIVEDLRGTRPDWRVAHFTPWATSDVAGLLGEFYSSLADALPRRVRKHIKPVFATVAGVAAPAAAMIPYAGGPASESMKRAGEALTKAPSWEKAFKKASERLKKLETPILVVVDDIDRLHVDELLTLLKVVRLLGRFDGVQYLLAYDDETLFRTLSASSIVGERGDDSGSRFIEKIVQYPLVVPPLLRHQQLSRLTDGLRQVSRVTDDGSGERITALMEDFSTLLRTPRAIDRYLAQLRHHIPLVPPEEIDDEDVQILTLLRVSFPTLFRAIPTYRNELTSGHTGEFGWNGSSVEYAKFDPQPLLALVPPLSQGVAQNLLLALFPRLRSDAESYGLGLAVRRGVSNLEYFDRYLAMGIPDNDVSDQEVRAAITAAANGASTSLRSLLLEGPEERLLLVLSKGAVADHWPTTDPARRELIRALADIANAVPDEGGNPFAAHDQLLTWIGQLLVTLDDATPNETIFELVEIIRDGAVRIRTWRAVARAAGGGRQGPKPVWMEALRDRLAQQAADYFIDHLIQGDSAATSRGVGYQVAFAVANDQAGELRARVQALLADARIDLSILASRLTAAAGAEGNWELSDDFHQELYNRLAPADDDPWYDEPPTEVDPRDLTWANRRRFAVGRVSRPPSSVDMPDQ